MSVDEAAGVEIPVTKGVETETDVVTEGGVDRGVVTEEVTVTNGELSNDGITDDEGSLSGDKLEDDVGLLIEDDVGLLIEEGTCSEEEVVGEGEVCFLFMKFLTVLSII